MCVCNACQSIKLLLDNGKPPHLSSCPTPMRLSIHIMDIYVRALVKIFGVHNFSTISLSKAGGGVFLIWSLESSWLGKLFHTARDANALVPRPTLSPICSCLWRFQYDLIFLSWLWLFGSRVDLVIWLFGRLI